ncbi:MAG TPA: S41 family peptidase [Planctomycetota bacterium]|nr:S41 family peptidase [Planctomycetota bacterium]
MAHDSEPGLSRRQAIWLCGSSAAAAAFSRWVFGKHVPRQAVYAKDVEFLLVELEKKAGHFFKLKGIDWPLVAKQFRREVKLVRSDAEHVRLAGRLLARLRDGHAALMDLKVQPPDESKGRRFTGPRVHLVVIGEKVHVRTAFGPALKSGIEAGMEVHTIDGVPARSWLRKRVETLRDENGYSTEAAALYAACHWGLADWEGTRITFDLARDGKRKRVMVQCQGGPNFAPLGPVHPPRDVKALERQSHGKTPSGYGYIHLRNVPANLPGQLGTMLEAVGAVPGLILDCRANGGGGCDHEAVFGRFLASGQRWRQYQGAQGSTFPGPMVVIVDAGVRSAGETISGMFKEDGRAYMIGDTPTSGSASQKEKLPVPSGMFAAYFSVASNKGRFNGGRGIEGVGVPPHEVVPYNPAELARGIDTQIRRAEEILKAGIPKGKVPYQPPG